MKDAIWAVTVRRPLKWQRAQKKGGAAGSRTQGHWLNPLLRLPAAPPFFQALCRFRRLQTVTAQIVSFIRHYRSSDHRGVPSIGFLHCCDYAYDHTHQLHTQQLTLLFINNHSKEVIRAREWGGCWWVS